MVMFPTYELEKWVSYAHVEVMDHEALIEEGNEERGAIKKGRRCFRTKRSPETIFRLIHNYFEVQSLDMTWRKGYLKCRGDYSGIIFWPKKSGEAWKWSFVIMEN